MASAVALLSALGPQGTWAAEWRFTPTLTVSERYTDNVSLAPEGQEKSDFITQVSPGFRLTGQGGRIRLNINYALQNSFHASQSGRNRTNHQLTAAGNAEIAKDLFFVDAKASVRQSNISLLGPIGTDALSDTGNLTTTKTLSLSPYVKQRFGSFATGEARYTVDYITHDASSVSDSTVQHASAHLASGPSFNDTFWRLNYDHRLADYENRPDVERTTVAGTLGYRLSRKWDVHGTVGYERNNFLYNGSKPNGEYWSVGVGWAPTSRTKLDANVGERFFGRTYDVSFQHRTRRTTWDLRYEQNVTTTNTREVIPALVDVAAYLDAQFAGLVPEEDLRAQLVRDLMTAWALPEFAVTDIDLLSNRVFLNKRLQGSSAVRTGKSTLLFTVYNSTRRSLEEGTTSSAIFGAGDFQSSSVIKQRGGSASWQWRWAPRTNTNVTLSWSRIVFPDLSREDDLKTLRFGVSKKLSTKATGTIEFRHLQRDSNQEGRDYTENSVSANASMQF